MAQLIAAQQGLATVNSVYSSQITQDFLSQGSITHKLLYATLLGGTGYVIGSIAFGEGLGGIIKTTQRSVTGAIPIFGTLFNKFNDVIDPPQKKTFLQSYGPAIGGVGGIVAGLLIG